MNYERLAKQIAFIVQIDQLKQVFRQNVIINSSRNEDDAEHSWHLAIMAILLSEYAAEEVDLLKVVKMTLIHDLVEIEAGDTFCYDDKANQTKAEREQRAAQHLFNILPNDQANEISELWREFEEMHSKEARFAASLDRLQPLLLNYNTKGHTWQKPGVTSEKVLKRNEITQQAAPALWNYAKKIIEESVKQGILKP